MRTPIVLITGGAGGIGSAIAGMYATNGYRVAFSYHKSEKAAHNLCAELSAQGGEVMPICCDVSSARQVEAMFTEIETQWGAVDILINNAGIAAQKLFTDITEAEWDEMFSVNCKGTFLCCRRALPSMISKKQGAIVNISSIWGMVGASCEVHYSAAKAGVIGLTKALAKEVAPSGVRVNCVAPGVIATPMTADLTDEDMGDLCEQTPLGKIGHPMDVAQAVMYLTDEQSGFVTGQVLSPNGGMVI